VIGQRKAEQQLRLQDSLDGSLMDPYAVMPHSRVVMGRTVVENSMAVVHPFRIVSVRRVVRAMVTDETEDYDDSSTMNHDVDSTMETRADPMNAAWADLYPLRTMSSRMSIDKRNVAVLILMSKLQYVRMNFVLRV
jgi:hypothetical protein